jgi:hypothetical protein
MSNLAHQQTDRNNITDHDLSRRYQELAAAQVRANGGKRMSDEQAETVFQQARRDKGYIDQPPANDNADSDSTIVTGQGNAHDAPAHNDNGGGNGHDIGGGNGHDIGGNEHDDLERLYQNRNLHDGDLVGSAKMWRDMHIGEANDLADTKVTDQATAQAQQAGIPLHDKEMARRQLATLAPSESIFTFQFFSDNKEATKAQKDAAAKTVRGTLDEIWPTVLELNTPENQIGVYVTVNETDDSGRRTAKNVTRVRGLITDADNPASVLRCEEKAKIVPPTMVVDTGRGSHHYWLRDDLPIGKDAPDPLPLGKFRALQEQLNAKLGTDSAVKDLPRVFRLAGTLHLKDRDNPRLIKLRNKPGEPVNRYAPVDLLAALGLVMPPDPAPKKKAAKRDYSADLTLTKIRAAVEFLAGYLVEHPDVLKDYDDWTEKLARPLAHQVMLHEGQKDELWQMLDEVSKLAPGYDEAKNAERFEHYIDEAKQKPADGIKGESAITIGTFFWWLQEKLGWDPDPVLSEMNCTYSAGRLKNKFRVAWFAPHPRYPLQQHVEFLGKDDFLNSTINPRVRVPKFNKKGMPDGTTMQGCGQYWFDHPKRNEYTGVTFEPGAPAVIVSEDGRYKTLNTYAGFAVVPDFEDSESKCKLFLVHLRDNVSGGDEGLYEYLVNWMASGVQKPGDPGRSTPILRGPPGAGKGATAQIYGKIYGRHFLHAMERVHVVGHFNAHQAELCFMFVDEALFAEIASDAAIMKVLTTEATKLLTRKGIDTIVINNYARLMLGSNSEQPITIEVGDRRYPMFLVREDISFRNEQDLIVKAQKRRVYFDALFDEADNGGTEALLGFLLKHDISRFNPECIPETAERRHQKLLSAPAGDQVIIGFAQAGALPGALHARPWLARAHPGPLLSEQVGLLDAMKARSGRNLAHLSDKKLTDILKSWGFTSWRSDECRGWKAPLLAELREKILIKYPAVQFDECDDWIAETSSGVDPKEAAEAEIADHKEKVRQANGSKGKLKE